MSAQKRAQSFRKFEVEPLQWAAPEPEELDDVTETEQPKQEPNHNK